VIAKHESSVYAPGKRVMIKVKHVRTADCVVAGFRWHKQGRGELIGSLLLGLYDDGGVLQHVGVTSSFTMTTRRQLAQELAPLRRDAPASHPWREWAGAVDGGTRMPGAASRWSQGKDLSWEPLRIERVCEVKYDHLQGSRFRHAAVFVRWRPDKRPADCRYDQLEVILPAELAAIFGKARK
jgi:ATP-dependent DNA ligase